MPARVALPTAPTAATASIPTTKLSSRTAIRANSSVKVADEKATASTSKTPTLIDQLALVVPVLDEAIEGKATEQIQEAIDTATRLLLNVGPWPSTSPVTAQAKLHRTLDRIHRRACAKLVAQGSNSRGQQKDTQVNAIIVDHLARACLSLLDNLYQQPEQPKTTLKAEALPNHEALLVDMVYGRRVLANKLFSASSRSSRDATLSELKQCHALFSRQQTKVIKPSVLAEQLRLLASSFQNPAGILYNASNYEEAAEFLRRAAECDVESVSYLGASSASSIPQSEDRRVELDKRREAITKKLEYAAVAYRFSDNKTTALEMYRKMILSLPAGMQTKLAHAADRLGIDELFRTPLAKPLASTLKAIVDLSVFELSLDLHSADAERHLTAWLLNATEISASVRGALLEQALAYLASRSHLQGALRAMDNVQQTLLDIYTAGSRPLRRARIIARQLELDVLSQRLSISEHDSLELEADALACLDSPDLVRDRGLQRFGTQYRSSILLISALAERMRHPHSDPSSVIDKVDRACKAMSTVCRDVPTTPKKASPHAVRSIVAAAAAAAPPSKNATAAVANASDAVKKPTARRAPLSGTTTSAPSAAAATTTIRRALSKRAAPPQAAGSNQATTPPPSCRTAKPPLTAEPAPTLAPRKHAVPKAASTATTATELATPLTSQNTDSSRTVVNKFDQPVQFCQSLEIMHEAFSAFALTRCSVEMLKLLRAIAKTSLSADDAADVYCRASANLAMAYSLLGKVDRAASVLNQAMSIAFRPGAATDREQAIGATVAATARTTNSVVVSQDVQFLCLVAGTEILACDGDAKGAEKRFAQALKLSKSPLRSGKDIQSSVDKLKVREKQAISFLAAASLQLGQSDLAGSIASTTMAIRRLIQLSSNLSHISKRTQDVEREAASVSTPSSDLPPPTSSALHELMDSGAVSMTCSISGIEGRSSSSGASDHKTQGEPQDMQRLPPFSSTAFSALYWRAGKLLTSAYLRLSRLHAIRGSGMDADMFASECVDFTSSMRFALPLAQALIQRGELRLQMNKVAEGQADLTRCLEVLQDTWIPEVVTLTCVQGDCLARIEQWNEALRSYTAGEATLHSLGSTFGAQLPSNSTPSPSPRSVDRVKRSASVRSVTSSHKASSVASPKSRADPDAADLVLPEMHGKLLRRQAWALEKMGSTDQSEAAVSRALAVRDGLRTVNARMDRYVLEGRIALRRAREHLKQDHFFSMLPEAAISIPMVPSVSIRTLAAAGASSQAISEDTVNAALSMLAPASSAFRKALALEPASSYSLQLREALASLAHVYTVQATLGKNVRTAAANATALLDRACSVGVRRNLVVAIANKLKSKKDVDAQEWPNLATCINGEHSPCSAAPQEANVERTSQRASLDRELDQRRQDILNDHDVLPQRLAKLRIAASMEGKSRSPVERVHPASAFWQSVRLRHQQSHEEAAAGTGVSVDPLTVLLPRNWTVISVSVMGGSGEAANLVLTRQEGGGGEDSCHAKDPVLYSLPLHRRSQREGGRDEEEEEEELTLAAAQQRLVEIVRSSNDGIHGVRNVEGMDARRQWWEQRYQLNNELRDLLQAIQDTWLGGFKGVFAEPSTDLQAKAALRARFEKIIRRACFPTANTRPSKLKLDDAVFECFAGLPAECTDEDLEDVVHYIMDGLQFSGFQVAVDEVDLDETAMDLRAALDDFRGKTAQASPSKPAALPYLGTDDTDEEQDHHLFLVLDKETAVFPWESMPILRGKAVSRIPSMAFLQDRIELAKIYHSASGPDDKDSNEERDDDMLHNRMARLGLGADHDNDDTDDDGCKRLTKGPSKHVMSKSASPSKGRGRSRSPSKKSRTKATTLGSGEKGGGTAGLADEAAWKIALRNGKLFNLSKRKAFYLLNPAGDLVQSQARFEPWLRSRSTTDSWRGIVGRQPIINEVTDALSATDLFLYFGHGGAEQYVRASKVRELERCAVAMLWGCSSAVLQDHGDFDRTGTPLNYMCAGSPAIVGNLWDLTDRELDSVCEGVFGRLGLMHESERVEVKKSNATTSRTAKQQPNHATVASRVPQEMSLTRAVAESRNDCKLPYLTGAAAVVYGVPVYWAD
ncbi:hypothetical protein BCV70DRAFT_231867 [Testicularia cyperi]|uniref:separase n=1 Tax=Testicularia cyperi TaxID=1882483 RepID=A0A317XSH5_9BASI|nr:hypothetical protein BCV70DRAFT_231867 [Testicularia cyperi]